MKIKPAAEERIWAVLAHLSTIAMGIGLFLPILAWSESRRKSNYASFQSLQALGYQTLGYTIWILVMLVVLIIGSTRLVFRIQTLDSLEADISVWALSHFTLIFGLAGLYLVLPIVAAVACAFGMDFRYPLMGNRLAGYLGYERQPPKQEQNWLIEEHEDRWVASMGHFAVIILVWGLTVPSAAWILQGGRSLFLKFQAVQGVVYQTVTTLFYLVAGCLYMFGMLVFVFTVGFEGEVALDTAGGMIGAIVFLVSLLIALLIILVVPFLHILGQWAGYRVLKGDVYRYPIVGRMVEKRLMKR